MRIVVDTNNLVSSLIQSRGPSALLIDAWLDDLFELITSHQQLDELHDVLSRPRIRKRTDPHEAAALVELIGKEALIVTPIPDVEISPDPHDNYIIGKAIAGNADAIVSDDKRHLLNLGQAAGISIITAREALEWLR